jgi:isochorismate pyruvate lyase
MDAAARIKTDRSKVRDVARVEQVVANVKAEAVRAGLDVDIADAVWRALIEASIQYEQTRWDEIRGHPDQVR